MGFLAPLLLRFPLLGKLPWKWIGIGLVLLVAWWQLRAYADRVADHRETKIRALWAEDTAKRDKAWQDQLDTAKADQSDATAIGKEVDHELEAKYAAAVTQRDDNLRLLQRAQREVRACSSNRASDSIIAHDASEARRLEELRRLDERYAAVVADLRAESGMNADQLDAVQDFLRRQRVCPIRVE